MKQVLTMDLLWPVIPSEIVVYVGGSWLYDDYEYSDFILVDDERDYGSDFEVLEIDPREDGLYFTIEKEGWDL